MLSDHERKTLREFERRFLAEDPEFARSFDGQTQHIRPAPDGVDEVALKIFLVAALLLSALMLVAGSLTGAVAFATATALIWLAYRFSTGTRPQSP